MRRSDTVVKKKHSKKKYNKGIPAGIARMDKELMSEIKMYYNITNSIEATAKAYGVSIAMVEYALRNACSFNSLQNEINKEKEES